MGCWEKSNLDQQGSNPKRENGIWKCVFGSLQARARNASNVGRRPPVTDVRYRRFRLYDYFGSDASGPGNGSDNVWTISCAMPSKWICSRILLRMTVNSSASRRATRSASGRRNAGTTRSRSPWSTSVPTLPRSLICCSSFDLFLQIDRTLIHQMTQQQKRRVASHAIIAKAHKLEVCSTAEGVKTEAQGISCAPRAAPFAGQFCSGPPSLEEFEELLDAQ